MKQLISIILIFLITFPILTASFTSIAYAFAGLDLNSTFARILESLLAIFFLDKIFSDNDKKTNSEMNSKVEKDTNISWKNRKITTLTANEEKMLELINQARAKEGLKKLKVDYRLVKIAREKSRDMIENNYFAHWSPTYGSPFNMFKTLGIDYYLAGENIAGAQEVWLAHQELMNSKSHRENILDPEFNRIGIGIIDGGPYGKMYAQEFANLKE